MKLTTYEHIALMHAQQAVQSIITRLESEIEAHNKIPFPHDMETTDAGDTLKFDLQDMQKLSVQLEHVIAPVADIDELNVNLTKSQDLSGLTLNELRAIRNERWTLAKSEQIPAKCTTIGKYLGKRIPSKYGPKYEWVSKDKSIKIFVDGYGGFTIVSYRGKQVLSTHQTAHIFIPGEWVKQIYPLSEMAYTKKHEQQIIRNASEADKLRSKLS